MKNFIPTLLTLLVAFAIPTQMDAQCKRFARQRVINTLDQDQILDRITSGTMVRGESASAVITIDQAGETALTLSTHEGLGEVQYIITDATGQDIAAGYVHGATETISVDIDYPTELIVEVTSEKAASAYTPIGCVAFATSRSLDVDTEFNLLTKE